jgi:hypothetical protein
MKSGHNDILSPGASRISKWDMVVAKKVTIFIVATFLRGTD